MSFYPNLHHFYCYAYFINNCSFKIKNKYTSADYVILSIKGFTNKNFSNRQLFLLQAPRPIVTRWGSWMEAALFYYRNFDEVKFIIENLDYDGILVKNAKNSISLDNITEELKEIAAKYKKILTNINKFVDSFFFYRGRHEKLK